MLSTLSSTNVTVAVGQVLKVHGDAIGCTLRAPDVDAECEAVFSDVVWDVPYVDEPPHVAEAAEASIWKVVHPDALPASIDRTAPLIAPFTPPVNTTAAMLSPVVSAVIIT
jgi:hypothetical protein